MTGGALLERTLRSIPPPDDAAAAEVARLLDAKTKPPGGLGRLEDVAYRLAAIRGEVPRRRSRRRSSWPPPTTVSRPGCERVPAGGDRADARDFAGGGAAICVLSREAGARLVVVDAGTLDAPEVAGVRSEIVDETRGTET